MEKTRPAIRETSEMLQSKGKACFECGRIGHKARDCRSKSSVRNSTERTEGTRRLGGTQGQDIVKPLDTGKP